MTALAACGRRYEALAAFDRLRESLTREFVADPEPATRRLDRDLLTGGDQSPDAAMAAGPATASPAALALSRTAATTALERRCATRPRPSGAWSTRGAASSPWLTSLGWRTWTATLSRR